MTDENTPTEDGPKELRDALERATARAEAAETGLKQFQAATFFDQAGLGEKQAQLFLQANPEAEITKEAVTSFIEEYGFSTAEPAPVAQPPSNEPPVEAPLSEFQRAAGSTAGSGTPAAQPVMSPEDWSKLLVDNPQEAAKAYVEGRAPRNEANVQARELVEKGIINH